MRGLRAILKIVNVLSYPLLFYFISGIKHFDIFITKSINYLINLNTIFIECFHKNYILVIYIFIQVCFLLSLGEIRRYIHQRVVNISFHKMVIWDDKFHDVYMNWWMRFLSNKKKTPQNLLHVSLSLYKGIFIATSAMTANALLKLRDDLFSMSCIL